MEVQFSIRKEVGIEREYSCRLTKPQMRDLLVKQFHIVGVITVPLGVAAFLKFAVAETRTKALYRFLQKL